MRVVKLLVMCGTTMSLPPVVYVRMENLTVSILGHSSLLDLITDKGLIVLISDHNDAFFIQVSARSRLF